jgi:hypothetical protein
MKTGNLQEAAGLSAIGMLPLPFKE